MITKMYSNKIFLILTLLTLFWSCEKDNNESNNNNSGSGNSNTNTSTTGTLIVTVMQKCPGFPIVPSNGTQVSLYDSQSNMNSGSNILYLLTTQTEGKATFTGLTPRIYYVKAGGVINTGNCQNLIRYDYGSVTVQANSTSNLTLTLD